MQVQRVSNQHYNQNFKGKFKSTPFMEKMKSTISEPEKTWIDQQIKYIESFDDGRIFACDRFSKNKERHTAVIYEIFDIGGKEKKKVVTSGFKENLGELFDYLADGYKFWDNFYKTRASHYNLVNQLND